MTYVIERKTSVTRRTRRLMPAPRFDMSASPRERKTDMSESTNTPTVVLVHGGFADASFWSLVIEDLQAHNVPVLAPPNPLRGLAHDAKYVASYVNQIDGPVLLVGHSYGGAVISVAGTSTPNAVGLVYVAAFALDEGESFGEIFGEFGETPLVGGVRRRSVGRADIGARGQPAAVRRDLRGSRRGSGLEDAALVGRGGDLRQRHPPGGRAPHGSARGRADDRGRRVALDRALAADCGRGADPHRRRGDVRCSECRLVEAALSG